MGVATALAALALAAVPFWRKRMPKLVAVLFLVAGAGLADAFVGGWVQTIAAWAATMIGQVGTGTIFIVLGVPALFLVLHDLWPKHSASRTTAYVAFLLPALMAGVGGVIGDTANTAIVSVGNSAARAITALTGVG